MISFQACKKDVEQVHQQVNSKEQIVDKTINTTGLVIADEQLKLEMIWYYHASQDAVADFGVFMDDLAIIERDSSGKIEMLSVPLLKSGNVINSFLTVKTTLQDNLYFFSTFSDNYYDDLMQFEGFRYIEGQTTTNGDSVQALIFDWDILNVEDENEGNNGGGGGVNSWHRLPPICFCSDCPNGKSFKDCLHPRRCYLCIENEIECDICNFESFHVDSPPIIEIIGGDDGTVFHLPVLNNPGGCDLSFTIPFEELHSIAVDYCNENNITDPGGPILISDECIESQTMMYLALETLFSLNGDCIPLSFSMSDVAPYIEECIKERICENQLQAVMNDHGFTQEMLDHFGISLDNHCDREGLNLNSISEKLINTSQILGLPINPCEEVLIRLYPFQAMKVLINSNDAMDKTIEIFGYNSTNDCSDAFRHVFFNAINTQDVGRDIAKQFSDAHECNQKDNSSYMDLHNNAKGHIIGSSFPNALYSILVDRVCDNLESGALRVLEIPNDNNSSIISSINCNCPN